MDIRKAEKEDAERKRLAVEAERLKKWLQDYADAERQRELAEIERKMLEIEEKKRKETEAQKKLQMMGVSDGI